MSVELDPCIIVQTTMACDSGACSSCIGFSISVDPRSASTRPCACGCHTIAEVTA